MLYDDKPKFPKFIKISTVYKIIAKIFPLVSLNKISPFHDPNGSSTAHKHTKIMTG